MAFWQDLPNETTPRNSENLSRSERYLTATAGLNGDFYVEIDGAGGLTEGDILRISFPEATSGSADARLSIDGGTAYKDIKLLRGANNIPAKLIQSGDRIVRYDGTRWVLESRLVAHLEITSPTMSFEINNLDIIADGGVYSLEITMSSSSGTPFVRALFNDVASTGSNYLNLREGYSESSAPAATPSLITPVYNYDTGAILATITAGFGVTEAKLGFVNNRVSWLNRGASFDVSSPRLRSLLISGTLLTNVTNVNKISMSTANAIDAGSYIKVFKN